MVFDIENIKIEEGTIGNGVIDKDIIISS